MRIALINPNWHFHGSTYFGCREAHLPLELGYALMLLQREGHEAVLIDGKLEALSRKEIRERVEGFHPDMTVIPTAPTYLFWRCPPPELRIPRLTALDLEGAAGTLVAVGPHPSTSPSAVLEKLGVHRVILGECEEILLLLAQNAPERWGEVPSTAFYEEGRLRVAGRPHSSDLSSLPAIHWPSDLIARHGHHHHRFDVPPTGAGAEVEASRGCPFACSFCAKKAGRDRYRKRPLSTVLEEMDGLISQGVRYFYFIDENFFPDRHLLTAIRERHVRFGIQTRIDLWAEDMLDLLGEAGCVSIEAGVESFSDEGRKSWNKKSTLSLGEMTGRLVYAKKRVAFVQANLLSGDTDDAEEVRRWRGILNEQGVWSNQPVPVFVYPGSPEYRRRWGRPDGRAWERAHALYLERNSIFSDLQDERPLPLSVLESGLDS